MTLERSDALILLASEEQLEQVKRDLEIDDFSLGLPLLSNIYNQRLAIPSHMVRTASGRQKKAASRVERTTLAAAIKGAFSTYNQQSMKTLLAAQAIELPAVPVHRKLAALSQMR